jgi:transcriptional regulator NrdR family protein
VSVSCPFCESEDVELVSAWGGQMITSQMRCRSCQTYFEAIREEPWTISYDDDRSAPPPPGRCS